MLNLISYFCSKKFFVSTKQTSTWLFRRPEVRVDFPWTNQRSAFRQLSAFCTNRQSSGGAARLLGNERRHRIYSDLWLHKTDIFSLFAGTTLLELWREIFNKNLPAFRRHCRRRINRRESRTRWRKLSWKQQNTYRPRPSIHRRIYGLPVDLTKQHIQLRSSQWGRTHHLTL